jgi:hypothetical protein
LDEYVLRCEDSSGLAEILVEGGLDRDVFADAVARWDVGDVAVVDSDYVTVSPERLQAFGLPGDGVKWRLVAIALELEGRAQAATVSARVAVVVDRDYDGPPPPSRFLFETDGHSLESYALDAEVLDRFVSIGLGRAERPAGRDGSRQGTPRTCSGADLLDRLLPAATEIAAVRRALREREPPLAPFMKWCDYAKPSRAGELRLDGRLLLARVFEFHGRNGEATAAEQRRRVAAAEVAADTFRLVRGKDFVDLLQRVLDSQWGRRFTNGAFRGWEGRQLSRFLMLAIPTQALDEKPLFQGVRAALAR